MQLSELIEAARVDSRLVKKEVTWKKPVEGEDLEQKTEDVVFNVHVVSHLSYGATERILRAAANPSLSLGAAIVSEAVRFGDIGADRLDYDTANTLHPGLIMALRKAVESVHEDILPQGADKKKN